MPIDTEIKAKSEVLNVTYFPLFLVYDGRSETFENWLRKFGVANITNSD
jgi:hypothetical protein